MNIPQLMPLFWYGSFFMVMFLIMISQKLFFNGKEEMSGYFTKEKCGKVWLW